MENYMFSMRRSLIRMKIEDFGSIRGNGKKYQNTGSRKSNGLTKSQEN